MARACKSRIGLALAVVSATALLVGAAAAHAVAPEIPITLVPSIHSGWEVNNTTGANLCTLASGNECREGKMSSGPGGFKYLSSVAVAPGTGEVYVADSANNRVQILSADGRFIAMFGWDVNATEDRRAGASQAARNVCGAASGDVCAAGRPGAAAGQLSHPGSVAVAPKTGDVYVLQTTVNDFRVDKYTSAGRFVWRIGRHVNATTHANFCSESEIERSHVRCGPGGENPPRSLEAGAFKFPPTYGNLLAAGGPEELLYVGDEHRVQEFRPDGSWKREILLASLSSIRNSDVGALTLDKSGNLYLVYLLTGLIPSYGGAQANVIHKFAPGGEPAGAIAVAPKLSIATVAINGLAIDAAGRLAAIGNEYIYEGYRRLGALYDAASARHIADFKGPSDNDGIAFNSDGDLYVAATDGEEVVGYVPTPVTELATSPVACEIGPGEDPAAAFGCALATG